LATSTRTAKKRDGEKRSDALAAIRELLAKGRLEEALACRRTSETAGIWTVARVTA